MELNDCLLKRRSVRDFTEEEISDEEIQSLMHAAMSGPSAMNQKPWDFYVIKNHDVLEKIKKSCKYTNYNGKVAIVVCGSLKRALKGNLKEFWIQDCASATENILLKAVDLSLSSVWCGVYPVPQFVKNVQSILNLDDDVIPLNIIWIGHPKKAPEERDQYESKRVHIIE